MVVPAVVPAVVPPVVPAVVPMPEMARCQPEQKMIIVMISLITKLYGFGRADEIAFLGDVT